MVAEVVHAVPGVHTVRRIRSRWVGSSPVVDVVVTVKPTLSTVAAPAIADAIERVLWQKCAIDDVTVHIEPDAGNSFPPQDVPHTL